MKAPLNMFQSHLPVIAIHACLIVSVRTLMMAVTMFATAMSRVAASQMWISWTKIVNQVSIFVYNYEY